MESNNQKRKLLLIAALGVVYGDIGTSPLYALRECFTGDHAAELTEAHIFGILSLIFWSLILIISLKYLLLIMRADNQGEGGILALMQLVLPHKKKNLKRSIILAIGLFGAALLYGDGMLTPAISVLSAVEGIELATPVLEPYIIPITITILVFLFWLQSRGTGGVGKLFGPIMLVWFVLLGGLGLTQIWQKPEIISALNPLYALEFITDLGWRSLFALGAVFLVVTGGEALYADIGHFGLSPIRKAWFIIVLPGLLLNYFGQGALLLQNPELIRNPFYYLAPEWALIPLICIATMATIIASQAVISGAFSLTFQAIQLNYLPRLRIFHTSKTQRGQVFLPKVNLILLIATIIVVLLFKTSSNIAVAYGIAIALTMVITDILAFFAMRKIWKWTLGVAFLISILFIAVDLSFVTANSLKFIEGGWFPILIAGIIYLCFRVWIHGQQLIRTKLSKYKNPLSNFVEALDLSNYNRVKGVAVFMTSEILETPIALQHNLKHNKVLHQKNIILSINFKNKPFVKDKNRMLVEELKNGFIRIIVKYGFKEEVDMYDILQLWREKEVLDVKTENLTFFLASQTIIVENQNMRERLEDSFYKFLRKNSLNATRYFNLPEDDVFEVGIHVKL